MALQYWIVFALILFVLVLFILHASAGEALAAFAENMRFVFR